MPLLELIKDRPGFRKQSARTWEGPCPKCGGDDRFICWINTDIFKCRGCDFKGDAITFLREVDGLSCAEAHQRGGVACDASDCPAFGKCGATRDGGRCAPRPERARKLATPADKEPVAGAWQPTAAVTPAERWQEKALVLVGKAHENLLATHEQLFYLEGRGIPRAAAEKHRLGWLAEDLYRDRESWGLEPALKPDGKKKKLWIPQGLVIPAFRQDGICFRVRIRLTNAKLDELRQNGFGKEPPRYYWLPGSGDDTWVINPRAKAFVIIESDLDGVLIDWLAGDLVGTIPLGTCSARPHQDAAKLLDRSACILNALDFEPRVNEKSGRNENPGGENWLRWWRPRYQQAKRHPVPIGKDPGEAFQKGVNIREWIIAGLPLGLRPGKSTAPTQTETNPAKTETKAAKTETKAAKTETTTPPTEPKKSTTSTAPEPLVQTTPAQDGRIIHVTDDGPTYARLVAEGKLVFDSREIELARLSGATAEQATCFLNAKQIFPGCRIAGVTKENS
ncbi:MAG: hypothetical protein ABSA86_07305 [Oryzomonas sp.]